MKYGDSAALTRIPGALTTLEPLSERWVNEIFSANAASDVQRTFFAFSSSAAAHAWVAATVQEMRNGEKLEYVILDTNGDFVGMIALNNLATRPEFGLWVAAEKRNRGYATDAVRTLRDWLFANTDMQELFYETETTNAASLALVQHLQLEPTGTIDRDGVPHVIFCAHKKVGA